MKDTAGECVAEKPDKEIICTVIHVVSAAFDNKRF